VPGTVRGKKWVAAKKQENKLEETLTLDIELGVDCDLALSNASSDEIVDLAGILGLHSMMNQDQVKYKCLSGSSSVRTLEVYWLTSFKVRVAKFAFIKGTLRLGILWLRRSGIISCMEVSGFKTTILQFPTGYLDQSARAKCPSFERCNP